ncbi:MAG: phosphoenolpyruvate synthase [Chlamydiia bacterium]|nr:phosphoenolpyruvate synthase [Chlamydiia bacterium]
MKQPADLFILWFDQINIEDIALVGGKNASLGEMHRHCKKKKIKIPQGFAITAAAYQYLLNYNDIQTALKEILSKVNPSDTKALQAASKKARDLILSSEIPDDLAQGITSAYKKLSAIYKEKKSDVAIRSSATAEDLPEASFAGQQESFLHIQGEKKVLETCKKCFASLFTSRAIAYRTENKIDHFTTSLSIGIQKMVRSDIGTSGVIFTVDTETGFADAVLVSASYGLGENIVQGAVDPDEFYVFKPTLKKGYQAIIQKVLGTKKTKITYNTKGRSPIKKQATTKKQQDHFCISDQEALQLAQWAVAIEEHYSTKHKKWTPVDVEWAKDGKTGEIFIVQARPETVQSRKNPDLLTTYTLEKKGEVVTSGKSVGDKIGQGRARVIHDSKQMDLFKKGEVLVTDITNPDWLPIMRIASAIVTNRGGRTSHAAIVSRELGLPCIVGTNNATHVIATADNVTVDCTHEEEGKVYKGLLPIHVSELDLRTIPKTKTKIMMNVGNPHEAFKQSFIRCDGVGLAREEFIISEYVRIHPMALIHFDKVKDVKERKLIQQLTFGYKEKKDFFIDRLAMGVAMIAAAFYPKDVILRFSDFKTNEYCNLIGGKYFEPKEENPMIGWRGASRYYKEGYKEGFALECAAIKKVREQMGLTNLKVMIPVCRTPEEGKQVLSVMKKNGLEQGKKGLEVYVMCEIPSNALLAEEFCSIFDGISIGSNDLTQMTLGVDRDNENVADLFDERSPAVKQLIKHMITIAKKKKCKIGICGEAPANYPEFTQFLIDCGIDSISASAEAVLKVRLTVAEYEKKHTAR